MTNDAVTALLLGTVAGFLGSMPLTGPIAALIVQRLLEQRRKSAMLTALGGAVVEGLYVAIIAQLMPLLMRNVDLVVPVSRGLGAVVIGAIGAVLIVKPGVFRTSQPPNKRASFATGAAIAAMNPTFLATWTIVITTFYGYGWLSMETIPGYVFAIGVALGTVALFAAMALVAPYVSRRIGDGFEQKVMRVLGIVLLGASLYLAIQFFKEPTAGSAHIVKPADYSTLREGRRQNLGEPER